MSSVGKAPGPTLVVYALTTPYTLPISRGGTPNPVQTAPIVQFEEVTKGYVPRREYASKPLKGEFYITKSSLLHYSKLQYTKVNVQ